jgi:hypothetical protein
LPRSGRPSPMKRDKAGILFTCWRSLSGILRQVRSTEGEVGRYQHVSRVFSRCRAGRHGEQRDWLRLVSGEPFAMRRPVGGGCSLLGRADDSPTAGVVGLPGSRLRDRRRRLGLAVRRRPWCLPGGRPRKECTPTTTDQFPPTHHKTANPPPPPPREGRGVGQSPMYEVSWPVTAFLDHCVWCCPDRLSVPAVTMDDCAGFCLRGGGLPCLGYGRTCALTEHRFKGIRGGLRVPAEK